MSGLKSGSTIGPYPYRIVKQLGAGAGNMSDVYLATVGSPEAASSYVVIKISKAHGEITAVSEDAIYNEAERLRKLDNRGVVRILPIQTDNIIRVAPYTARASSIEGQPWFLALEYLVGGSLADILDNYGQLDIKLAIEITRKIAQTLEYLHDNDHIHLDIKPENILFRYPLEAGKRVEPVLIDFGIARNTGQAGLEGSTLHYAPPERVLSNRGNAPPETLSRPSPAMDVYSLGVVLYQMLAGRRPFEGRTPRSISSAILESKPTRPSKYSNLIWKELDDLVMEMLSRDPLRRPTAGELVEMLDVLRSKPAYQLPRSPSGKTVQIADIRWRSRFAGLRNTLAILLLFLLLGIGAGEAIHYSQTGQFWSTTLAELQLAPERAMAYIQAWVNGFISNLPNLSSPGEVQPPTSTPAIEPTKTEAAAPAAMAATETLTPTPTEPPATETSTATSTRTQIPTQIPTRTRITSTPVPALPTSTMTATPSPIRVTETKSPTATPVPNHTPTATSAINTATSTAKAATNTPKPPKPIKRSVTLIAPPSGTVGKGDTTFSWQANFKLEQGQAFELIIWREGEDPMISGKGWLGMTTKTSITGNLSKSDAPTDSYLWGVLLVQANPYKRIEYLGGGWKYKLEY